MEVQTASRALLLVLFTVSLCGCALLQLEQQAEAELTPLNEFAQVSVPTFTATSKNDAKAHALPKFRGMSRPLSLDWLLDRSQVTIRELDAERALKLVLSGRPVHFELSLESTPIVSYRSAATHTIHDAIQAICNKADWQCDYNDDVLTVRDLVTRTIPILAQPGTVDGQLSVNSLNDSQANQFADGETVNFKGYNPYIDELEPLISGLLASDVAAGIPVQQQLLPRANAVLITGRPSTVAQIEHVLEQYNARTAKLVRVFLTVYEVSSSTSQSIGSKLAGLGFGSKLAGAIGWSTQPLQADGIFQLHLNDPSSQWQGSQLLFEWLQAEGDASVHLNDQLDVRNNRIASSSSTRTFQYVSSITRELDNLGRERTEVTREQLRTGWAISVHPTIGLDKVTVRLSLARRALVEERPFAFGDTTGTNFVTDDQNRSMNVTLRDGEARVITLLTSSDERQKSNKLAGLVTRKGREKLATESVILMRVELI